MHLLLVRHGETEWNVQRRIQGWTNSALTPFGKQQISLLGKRLLDIPIAAVYTSPSERTRLTAHAAVCGRDIAITPMPDLRETSWGEWEGKTAAEINAIEPELWARFLKRGHEDPSADQADWEATTLVPGGESLQQASDRINSGIVEIFRQHRLSDDWVVVVGHGGSLRLVIASLMKQRPVSSRLFHLDNAAITHFFVDRNRVILKVLNDRSHWEESLI